ncbi:MAG: hypothetical protein A4E45_02135 [Methanosaeta sp. PtaB.Bin039]|nr:MAG: hypothetical protein A4E45_02135 [Methanosaeta sp. PtaB.Bin039]OPY50262.1 MAG: hypothetical protein A4E49_02798 [Methanosaeta sp. PtaU1.Bin112]
MRNRLVHAYFDINLEILWRTVQDDLPPLIAAIERCIKKIVCNGYAGVVMLKGWLVIIVSPVCQGQKGPAIYEDNLVSRHSCRVSRLDQEDLRICL